MATGIYRYTSIARPVDPAYPTNKTLLILLPVGAIVFALAAFVGLLTVEPAAAAFAALLTGFASWALTRELAPDDDAAAFLALALAWLMAVLTGATGVLALFVALVLTRIVNRSTGLPLRPWDTVMVLGFALWSADTLGQPLLGLVAALAFAADAALEDGPRLHWGAALVCVVVSGWWLSAGFAAPDVGPAWFAPGAILIGCVIVIALIRAPVSVGDASGEKLTAPRVKIGLAIGCFVGAQSLFHGQAWTNNLIWTCLAAVPLSAAARGLFGGREGDA